MFDALNILQANPTKNLFTIINHTCHLVTAIYMLDQSITERTRSFNRHNNLINNFSSTFLQNFILYLDIRETGTLFWLAFPIIKKIFRFPFTVAFRTETETDFILKACWTNYFFARKIFNLIAKQQTLTFWTFNCIHFLDCKLFTYCRFI